MFLLSLSVCTLMPVARNVITEQESRRMPLELSSFKSVMAKSSGVERYSGHYLPRERDKHLGYADDVVVLQIILP
jgi:hypothetical protein